MQGSTPTALLLQHSALILLDFLKGASPETYCHDVTSLHVQCRLQHVREWRPSRTLRLITPPDAIKESLASSVQVHGRDKFNEVCGAFTKIRALR
eukprot:CAMPEP_0194494482 /NCGR_PEP_ID=MMETSP0253-20130528/12374_1 /TAXON_ID=2966 /ORGANISM="Noctiluca scintillans" /LENGTH=94 /DNA_ID=CAMNT_0039335605 /DNA_START=785 /DNA_END=1065 /DNA_ORIENTATION=-